MDSDIEFHFAVASMTLYVLDYILTFPEHVILLQSLYRLFLQLLQRGADASLAYNNMHSDLKIFWRLQKRLIWVSDACSLILVNLADDDLWKSRVQDGHSVQSYTLQNV